MPWTERQREMLRTMGVALWSPVAPSSPAGAEEGAPKAPAVRAGGSASSSPATAGAAARRMAPQGAAPPGPAERAPVSPPAAPAPRGVAVEPGAGGMADDPRRAAIVRMDWQELRQAAASCQACGLGGTRRQSVFGVGHPQAHWLVVGEAPGEQEDLQGEPFVGAAGQLLDAMLQALSLTRAADGPAPPSQRVYIANTLKCRPPQNRNPAPDEMAACEPFLLRQIDLLKPRIILAMGRFAVQTLLRSSEPIGRLRGRVHRYHGVPLVVTYHPAYLLRNLPDKARAWEDLCLAAETAEQGADAGAAALAPPP